ncbi:hypothetical protein D9758_007309 [Tetrapyrgos nigripes]|uniref:intramembrane prenyl-peptidase Rce1 n=1 Tax=Tetrapyrgos nigripes TaxID=182062 RepID=A0A8H5LLJ2_9AGAR|nr:hypothetical protein D9758_007309 [Tetrapyrgos nigripes]
MSNNQEAMRLSSSAAHFIGLAFAGIYVSSLYVSKYCRIAFASATPPDYAEGSKSRLQDFARNGSGNSGREEDTRRLGVQRRVSPRDIERNRGRDDPVVIRERLSSVSCATVLCIGLAFAVISQVLHGKLDWDLLRNSVENGSALLGLKLPPFRLSSFLPHLVIPTLFLGPLSALFLSCFTSSLSEGNIHPLLTDPFSLIVLRNYMIAPITEELVFRSCILAVYLLTLTQPDHPSAMSIILLSPLHFGVAHLHHARETYKRLGRTQAALKRAVLQSTFQMLYTTLFGALCAFLYLRGLPSTSTSYTEMETKSAYSYTLYESRTPSVYAPISAHIFCNCMGFPDFAGDVKKGRMGLGRVGGIVVGVAYFLGLGLFGWMVWSERGREFW